MTNDITLRSSPIRPVHRDVFWSAAGRSLRRCLVLSLLATIVAASEDIPFLDATYRASPELALAPPLAGWWAESVRDASTWFDAACGASGGADAALIGLRSLHLVAIGSTGASGIHPLVAARWHGAPPAGAAGLLASWADHQYSQDANGATLTAGGTVAPASADDAPVGWRVHIDGRALVAEAKWRYPQPPEGIPVERFAAWQQAVSAWRISAGVDPASDGARGWIDTGLPAAWFAPIDQKVLARTPPDAVAVAAVAIDARRLLADAGPIIGEALPLVIGKSHLPIAPEAAAEAMTGTWYIAATADHGFLVRAPRSEPLDALVAFALASEGVAFADSDQPQVLDELWFARGAQEWILADSAKRIVDWRASPGKPSVAAAPGTSVWAWCTPAFASEVARQTIEAPVAVQFGLRIALGGPSVIGFELGIGPSRQSKATALDEVLGQLKNGGDHALTARTGQPTLVLDLSGPVLPWAMTGLTLRWFADYAQDQTGRAHLRRQIQEFQTAGVGALPSDLVAMIPPIPAPVSARARALRERLSQIQDLKDFTNPALWTRRMKSGPAVQATAAETADATLAEALLVESTVADDAGCPSIGDLAILDAAAANQLGPMMKPDGGSLARRLLRAGTTLIALEDARGLVLVDRAHRLVREPRLLVESLSQWGIAFSRDQAWLVAILSDLAPADTSERWLSEPARLSDAFVPGERMVMIGWAAASWLGLPAAPVDATDPRSLLQPGLFTPHLMWARSAEDLGIMMRFFRQRELGNSGEAAELADLDSPCAGMLMPAIGILKQGREKAQARHALLRLAARLGRAPEFAEDAKAAEAMAGPLTVPFYGTDQPLRYERTGRRAFRLWMEPAGDPPKGLSAAAWKKLEPTPPAPDKHPWLIVEGKTISVQIDLEPAAAQDASSAPRPRRRP
ncbi:MAG: hypothetical protein H0W83_00310 [Planctomycetes bacterium]|nr:hypothetical protein [Planctomycetota bacterium]